MLATRRQNLHSRASTDIVPIGSERAPPGIHILVLPSRTQRQLVVAEVQIAIDDSRAVCMLDEPRPYERLDEVVLRFHRTGTPGSNAVDLVRGSSLLCLHVFDRVVLMVGASLARRTSALQPPGKKEKLTSLANINTLP